MMGRQSRQTAMIFVDIESLIPETHLLRKIERMVSFNFIYDLLAPYYPATGRPSVDPVSMFKMLLIGYLYGIKSERRLVEEVQLNIAYRWFCGFELDDTIPNHSTFSKTRTRKWQQSSLFQKAFYEIVKQCIDSGLIDGEAMAADGSYIPANVSRESWSNVETEVENYLAVRIPEKTSEAVMAVMEMLKAEYGDRFAQVFKTITVDNGSEFADFVQCESWGAQVFFAHPYTSWERAQNERHNGLFRAFVPKGTSMEDYSAEDILRAADELNARPRKKLGYATPEELFDSFLDRVYAADSNPS